MRGFCGLKRIVFVRKVWDLFSFVFLSFLSREEFRLRELNSFRGVRRSVVEIVCISVGLGLVVFIV